MALASLASSKDSAHLTFEEMSFAWPEAKYRTASLLRLRWELINDREVNIRPRDIPAAKAIIINFFLVPSTINALATKHEFYFNDLSGLGIATRVIYSGALQWRIVIFGIWQG